MATSRKAPARKTAAAKKSTAAPARKPATAAAKAAVPAALPDKQPDPTPAAAPEKIKHGKFAMPKADHALIDALKKQAKKAGQPVRKNELLRAGLRALKAMDAAALHAAIAAVRSADAPAKPKVTKLKPR